jgi:DNA-binding transcriptional LysR family regulator
MLSLRQLHYFVVVAEEGQMRRAAGKLHIVQPALSQAIAHLESRLGIQLLERRARGIALTTAGEAFLPNARLVLAAAEDATRAARSLARTAGGDLEWGFVGSPPMMIAPELFGAFTDAHPNVKVSFRELTFPCGSPSSWLADVDVALCYSPTPHPEIRIQELRREPRVVLLATGHPLAWRDELTIAEVLDETFCGTSPSLEPIRAGFWRLDDHRGEPAPHVTDDQAINPHEVLACIASGRAIITAPASNAANVLKALTGLTGVTAIPLRDARPALLALTWRKDNRNPNVERLATLASSLHSDRSHGTALAGV